MNHESIDTKEEKVFKSLQDNFTQELIEELKAFGIVNPKDPWLTYESIHLTEDKVKQIEALFDEFELEGELKSDTEDNLF